MTITELESPFAKRRKHRISKEQEKITPQEAVNLTKMALAEPEPDYDLDEDEIEPDYSDEESSENRATNGFERPPYSRQNTKLDYVANLPPHRLRETIRAYADRNYLATRNPHELFPRLVAPMGRQNRNSDAMVPNQSMYKENEFQMRNNVRHRPLSGRYPNSFGDQRQSYPSSSNFQAGLQFYPPPPRHRRDTRLVREDELERAFSRRMFNLNYV